MTDEPFVSWLSGVDYEEKLSLTVGKIVRAWAAFDDAVTGQIPQIQTLIRVRQLRSWRKEEQPALQGYPKHFDWLTPGRKFKLKMRYWRRLHRAATSNAADHMSAVDKVMGSALELVVIRDRLVHGASTPEHFIEDSFSVEAREWHSLHVQDAYDGKPKAERRKYRFTHTFSEADRWAERMVALRYSLNDLTLQIGVDDPIPNAEQLSKLLEDKPRGLSGS